MFIKPRHVLAALATASALFWARPAYSMPASPFPIQLAQPDGTPITLYVRGNEHEHWFEDTAGYTVVRSNEQYHYATLDGTGRLAPTGLLVGKVHPQGTGLPPGLKPMPQGTGLMPRVEPAPVGGETPNPVPASGTVKNLVVLCKFSDHTAGVHTRVQADYDTLFNAVGGDATLAPTGSVRDCFDENSYGALTLQSTVLAWVTLPQTQAYYANGQDGTGMTYPQNAQGMVRDALNLADALVDFGQFDADNDGYVDAITFIHSGYGAETGGGSGNWIWSHRWSLWALPGGAWTSADVNGLGANVKVYDYHTEPALWGTSGTAICRIGVICHETGHFFGLPDLYDTDYSGEGAGSWCMMANSWGFDSTQLHPPHFSAWCKAQLGWITPTVIGSSGSYSADYVEGNPVVYKITNGYAANEYLLVENRQPAGFESVLPHGGLAIWHVDDNKANNNGEGYPGGTGWPASHYKVALLQADGLYQLEKGLNSGHAADLYYAGGVAAVNSSTIPSTNGYQGGTVVTTSNAISNISASGATMTFDVTIGAAPTKAAMTSPVNGSTLTGSSATFQWNTGTGVTEYWLDIGTTVGGTTLYHATAGTSTSKAVSGLPLNGSTLYVRLWSKIDGTWQYNDYTYVAATSTKAAMTSPANGSTLTAASVTFQWNAGTGVTEYWLDIGTVVGGKTIYRGSAGTSTSKTVTTLPVNGITVYVRLWSRINGVWHYNDYTYTAVAIPVDKAAMTSPANGSTFAASSVTFQWTTGTGVTEYWLDIGTAVGGTTLYHATAGTSTSKTVSGLPVTGSTLYVRLWSRINGTWHYNDYTYTAATIPSAKAAMTSPANGSTFAASSVTFQWTTGSNVSEYWLDIGTAAGGTTLHHATAGTSTSKTVSGLPANGSTLYVRLWSRINGAWQYNDYTYTAATGVKAAMTSPANGSTFTSASVTFQWSAGVGVTEYWLDIGTAVGGTTLHHATAGTSTSKTVSGLPVNGSTFHVRLYSRINGAWQYSDYTYTAATSAKAAMTSPANGSTLTGTSATFQWTTGNCVTEYWLDIGTAVGGMTLYHATAGTSTSKTVSVLPANGSTVHVRLWSRISGAWQYNDYTYTSN